MSLFPPTPDTSPRRTQAARSGTKPEASCIPHHGRETSQDLHRRQSVRFMGPCSVKGEKGLGQGAYSHTRRNSMEIGQDTAQLQPNDQDSSSVHSYSLANNVKELSILHQSCQPPKTSPSAPVTGIAADYLHALVSSEDYYTPEDNIASAPSSYRRIRKSRSMFTSEDYESRKSQDDSVSFVNGRVPPTRSTLGNSSYKMVADDKENDPMTGLPPLKTPKSMSFLRTRSTHSRSDTHRASLDQMHSPLEAPSVLGNGSHASERGTPRLVSKASTIFSARNRRAEPRMRKSLRSASWGDDLAETNPNLTLPTTPSGKDDGFKRKARKVSKSLKTKLKSFFSLAKSEDSCTIPVQHIDSQRTHVMDDVVSIHSTASDQEVAEKIEWGSIHQVASKIPSLQIVPSNLHHSNKGSLESLRSERERNVSDDKSLTTWVHSGPSTLTSQQQEEWREWERQRLSIIKEGGTHAPSPSIPRQALGTQLFQRFDGFTTQTNPPGLGVDSQRVYSALMKRVRDMHNQTFPTAEQQREPGSLTHAFLRERSSLRSLSKAQHFYHDSDHIDTPTRASRKSSLSGCQEAQGHQERMRPSSAMTSRSAETGWGDPKGTRPGVQAGRSKTAPAPASSSQKMHQDPFTEHDSDVRGVQDHPFGGQQLHDNLGQNSAASNTPSSHLFRTTSPFRRTLRESMEAEYSAIAQAIQESIHHISSEDDTRIRYSGQIDPASNNRTEVTDNNDYTESVYSTDEIGNGPLNGALDDSYSLCNRRSVGSPLAYHPANHRIESSASSVDWKTWLSANIGKDEASPSTPVEVAYAIPTMPNSFPNRHVRESTQINEECEDDGGVYEPPTHRLSLPISPLATIEPNVVKLSPEQRSIKRTTPPLSGRALLENDSPGAPPIPAKSVLRCTPSPLKRSSGPNPGHYMSPSITSSPGLSAAVQRQFGPVFTKQNGYVSEHQKQAESPEDGHARQESVRAADNKSFGKLKISQILEGGFRRRVASSDSGAAAFL
ncbi:hypothetical protein GE21DRAFT_2047 [Neurospora crassa]|uniref:Uncharacterized protein n=1 Tax=Neurospora crassa (strain ATCC 24698 / 74-OR23-1A / CBS 708.71 / DSM 1257 / FGSC 987) TaxID=367110 RepID=Q7SHX9_NEUCR|nr:hypothetical protein NCU00674 [Neurospora crassa OR74A]EAA36578.3 hypothetical protein NCU00674 [Neurospora crassa OR74A]KHE89787.1 hypothetical protein GE21DRAFT_2047 [Neurospora crassa]|eukprot:XP_965814.3 hypothetical protein NCU00674 [Neurospora crassa OR74A]